MRNLALLVSTQLVVSSYSFQRGFQPADQHLRSFLVVAATKSNKPSPTTSRRNRIFALDEWAKTARIQATNTIKLQDEPSAGLGWFAGPKNDLPSGSVLLTVPAAVALTVESPGAGPDDASVSRLLGSIRDNFPWYIQMAVYLHKLDTISSQKSDGMDMRPWLDSLPRRLDTPIHWSNREELQYEHMVQAVQRQEKEWRRYYNQLAPTVPNLNWESFLWAAEMARSRAFSGSYTGSAFNPLTYAFTLLLVTAYMGFGLGTLEQAANGAGVVVCASILKDFVVPKLTKTRRYVICPMIDMANHQSMDSQADVAFEYFGNAYSLALVSSSQVLSGQQVFISYGTRSNDQLLQYYGFVEPGNPHDVYVMPPLRDWDIAALEVACGRKFADGRLVRLERAGLLGGSNAANADDERKSYDEAANQGGGVVLTRAIGIDPAVLQALRALVSTDIEWKNAGEAVGNFCEKVSDENESCAKAAARKAIEMELESKPTTLGQDRALLTRMDAVASLDASVEDKLAVLFRIEKKKVLAHAINML